MVQTSPYIMKERRLNRKTTKTFLKIAVYKRDVKHDLNSTVDFSMKVCCYELEDPMKNCIIKLLACPKRQHFLC
jgi:hypothetical protein